ncbi:MAG: hypothetical protein ABR502_05690 [Chitinophagaceae bacterium]
MEKQTKKFFIAEYLLKEKVYHGGIGNVDIEKTLLQYAYKPIYLPFQQDFSIKAKIIRAGFLIKTFFLTPANSLLVFQMPLYAILSRTMIRLLRFRKSVKKICILSDIDGLRDDNKRLLETEVLFFRSADYFITHNDMMKNWLMKQMPGAKVSNHEFFPFLTPPPIQKQLKSKTIVFAGNLEKSKFLNDLWKIGSVEGLLFNLYGEGYLENEKNKINTVFKGIYEAYDLPQHIDGSFGLVWDGDSIEDINGAYGNYLRYNSPHKLSLYLVAGLPVIAHTDAACALLIKKYNIGFTVNTLYEIADKINKLHEDEYQAMHERCLELGQKISTGETLINALKALSIH